MATSDRDEVAQVGLDKVLVKVQGVWVDPAEVESVLPRDGDTVVNFRSGERVKVYKMEPGDVVAVLASGARAAWPPRRMVSGMGPGTMEALARKMGQ